MAEISNKTLAILLVGAIVVSLMGTFISLNRLTKIGPTGLGQITGMYTVNTSGNVILGVTGSASFRVNTNVNFGTITPNSTGFWISTNDNNTWAGALANNCSNIAGSCHGIEIENDGNQIINISFNTSTNAATLIGGTTPAPVFSFLSRNGNRSGTGNENGCNGTVANPTFTSITANTNYILCNGTSTSGFGYVAGADKITMEFNLTIPADAPQRASSQATIFLFNEP
jgi:hypothetical protein